MRVLTQQPQGKTFVNRTTKIGRDITFLWSGANPADDSADSLSVGSGVNPQLIITAASNRGKTLVTTTTGAIEWRLFDPGTGYTVSSGLLRKSAVWSQGVVFKYRSASEAGTNTTLFNITNGGSWNHRIFVNASGFVQVRNPNWTAGVFLTGDTALIEGDWTSVVVVWESGNTRFYVNGVLQTQTDTQTIYTAGLERVHFSPVGVDILTAFVADTGWTGQDALSWHNNPWQLFKAQVSVREKLSQQFHFTDLLPTYPPLKTIRIPNRDSDGLFKAKIEQPAGNKQEYVPNTMYMYPVKGTDGVYLSIDKRIYRSNNANYGGTLKTVNTPYGPGIDASTGYQVDYGLYPGGLQHSLAVYMTVFYLYDNQKTVTSKPRFYGETQNDVNTYTDHVIYWSNVAGEKSIVFSPSPNNGGVPISLSGIQPGLYCALMYVVRDGGANGVGIFLNGKKVATTQAPSGWGSSQRPSLDFFDASISQSGENVANILFQANIVRKTWTDEQLVELSKDPFNYFFKDAYTNKENLLRSLTFDVPQAITRSSYVQTANMPRKFVPVNMAHPLTRGIKFASGPAWGNRDAADSRIRYSEIAGYRQMTRFGEAFLPGAVGFSSSVSDTIVGGSSSHTTMFIGCIELDGYPNNTATYPEYLGVDWDDNNSFQIRVDANGRVRVGIQNNAGQPRYLTGSREIFPLRKLGVAISVVEAGVGTTLYINGKVAGFSTFAPGTTGQGVPRRVGYAIPNTGLYGKQYLACGWHRALSPAEVQQISENPWQIFQQPSKFKNRYAQAVLDISRKFLLFFG